MSDFALFWMSLNKEERRLARLEMLAEAEKTMPPHAARTVVDMAIANAKKGLLDDYAENDAQKAETVN